MIFFSKYREKNLFTNMEHATYLKYIFVRKVKANPSNLITVYFKTTCLPFLADLVPLFA